MRQRKNGPIPKPAGKWNKTHLNQWTPCIFLGNGPGSRPGSAHGTRAEKAPSSEAPRLLRLVGQPGAGRLLEVWVVHQGLPPRLAAVARRDAFAFFCACFGESDFANIHVWGMESERCEMEFASTSRVNNSVDTKGPWKNVKICPVVKWILIETDKGPQSTLQQVEGNRIVRNAC